MKNLIAIVILITFLLSCKENKVRTKSNFVIANGQMPALVKDKNNTLHLVFGSGDSLLYTSSTNNGFSFSAPAVLKVLPHVYTYAMRGPQIAATNNGLIVTACTTEGNIYSFTKPNGSGWQQEHKVNDKDTVCKEGLMALSVDGNKAFAVWLDVRDNGRDKIYGARSVDGGNTWSRNTLIYTSPDSTVCECCKPSVVVWKNNVAVMFRNWLHGNRDLYLIQSADGGNTFGKAQKLGTGSWKLDGCPMDGGGLAVNTNGDVETVWRRETTLYTGKPSTYEQKVGEGRSCTLEVVNNLNVYAWVENGRVMILKPGGKKEYLGTGGLPALKAIDNQHLVCVWENEKQIHVSVVQL